MPVSQNPSLTELRTFFNGSNKFSDYIRNGAYVPDISVNSAISTIAAGLRLSQFKGADKSVPFSATISGTVLHSFGSQKGTFNIGTSTITPSGGSGTYTYTNPVLISGADGGDFSNITWSGTGPSWSFRAVNIQANTESISGVWRVGVSDGSSTKTFDISVLWN